MAKKKWVIGTQEGADFASRQGVAAEVGSELELELSYHEEKAMVAAGWVEEPKTKKKEG
jgi:hypothetical protein